MSATQKLLWMTTAQQRKFRLRKALRDAQKLVDDHEARCTEGACCFADRDEIAKLLRKARRNA